MIVGLMLGTLLGFSALSVDIGMIRVADTQLQAAIDAAALSGASELDGTLTGILKAKVRARDVAAANPVLDTTLSVPISAIEVGDYDEDTGTFTVWDNDPDKAPDQNAVRIDFTPPQVGAVLGSVAFGIAGYDVNARGLAIRQRGAGVAKTSECYLPFAVPDCWVSSTPPGQNPLPLKFSMYPSTADAIAWGDLDGNPSSDDIKAQLLSQCTQGTIEVGDPIYVNEGAHTTALQAVGNILNNTTPVEPTTWDTTLYGAVPNPRDGGDNTANLPFPQSDVKNVNWGNTLEGPIALVDAGADCSNVSFTGTVDITGIAWGVIYDVKDHTSDKNIYVQLDLINEHEIWGEIDYEAQGNVMGTSDPVLVNY